VTEQRPTVTAPADLTDDELAAVLAAVQVVLAQPSGGGGWPSVADVPRWRFSGRWWSKPIPVRRDRPF